MVLAVLIIGALSIQILSTVEGETQLLTISKSETKLGDPINTEWNPLWFEDETVKSTCNGINLYDTDIGKSVKIYARQGYMPVFYNKPDNLEIVGYGQDSKFSNCVYIEVKLTGGTEYREITVSYTSREYSVRPSVNGEMTEKGNFIEGTGTNMQYRLVTENQKDDQGWSGCQNGKTQVDSPGKYEVRYKVEFPYQGSAKASTGVGPEKPTNANAPTDLVYSGAEFKLIDNFVNYGYTACVTTGSVGTDARTYEANVALGEGYPVWSDGTSEPVGLQWKISPKDIEASDVTLTYPDPISQDEGSNDGSCRYNGDAENLPIAKWKSPLADSVDPIVVYVKDDEQMTDLPKGPGTYDVYVQNNGEALNFGRTTGLGVKLGTLTIEKAEVSIVSFSSDPVMEGSPMTMKVTFKTAGDITEDPVIRYGDSVLPLTGGGITDLGDGLYEATVVYDTSEGIIPSGIYRTVSVQYPGDDGHHPSDAVDCEVCVRTEGKIVIPEEGGKFPADPGKKNDVVTPTGQMEVVVDDDRTGGTPIIWIRSWDAEDHEKVPEADKTVVIESDGYVIGKDGERIPIGYEIIHTIDVDVPNGKRPIVKLYDEEGNLVETPKIMSYTSGSVTFRTEAEGFQHIRVAVTFETAIIPLINTDTGGPGEGNDAIGAIVNGNSEPALGGNGKYILLIAIM